MRTVGIALLAMLAFASAASANTAREAFAVPLDNQELGRPCGNGLSGSFDWNCPIEAGAKVQSDSQAQVDFLMDYIGYGKSVQPVGHRWWGATAIYTADAATPIRTVCLAYAVDGTFSGWKDYMRVHDILAETGVPIPTDPSGDLPWKHGGSDKAVVIYSPSMNRSWEFWLFAKAPAGTVDPRSGKTCDFLAGVGQQMLNVGKHADGVALPASTINPGYWIQNETGGTDATFRDVAPAATKLPALYGNVTTDEWNDTTKPDFGHALRGVLPYGRRGSFIWPAASTDATSAWVWPAIQEGARMRLASDADCGRGDDTLKWVRARKLCNTLKTYGEYFTDQTWNGWGFLSFQWGGGARADDGASDTPNWYLDAFKDVYKAKLEVLESPAGKGDWTPGCEC